MTRGMYTATGGMLSGLLRQDVLANNLANANTPGFKCDRSMVGAFQSVLLPSILGPDDQPAKMMMSGQVEPTLVDIRPGSLTPTDADLDLAVEGDGWFVVQGPTGELYTRNGHFTRSAFGTLVTAQGYPVLTDNGPVEIDGDADIRENGEVRIGGQTVGRLRLVRFTAPETLQKVGDTLVAGGAPEAAEGSSQVRQGMLEGSNADPMRTMVEMIGLMRSFEMNQRVIQAQDQTLQHAIDIARR